MNVCLVIPPSPFLLDERVFPSLGVLSVANSLEDVSVLDLAGRSIDISYPIADVYGITATTPQMPATTGIAKRIKMQYPQARVILGGPHPTLVLASLKKGGKRAISAWNSLDIFDTVVAGDGEEAILEAVEPNAPHLIDADNNKSPLWQTNDKFNARPFPARHLIDMDSYHYEIEGKRATSLIGQLGCPFGCNFCGGRLSPMLRQIRKRSVESIIKELESLPYEGFMFYDDELNVAPSFVELMKAIARMGRNLRLRGFIKAELFTEEQAEAMYGAGFRWILVGFESGSDQILKTINKKATREDNTRCLAIARKAGLKVKALMSLGHPGESPQTIRETEEWLLKVRPDDFDVTVITTYPGTPYYDLAVPHGKDWVYDHEGRLYQQEVDYAQTADYYKGRAGDYVSHVWTDYLSPSDLVKARDALEKDIRSKFSIPAPKPYEHSMGQTLPPILK
jgi:radical SAM superfamily enzyme YgiQ (UPF0313 family)